MNFLDEARKRKAESSRVKAEREKPKTGSSKLKEGKRQSRKHEGYESLKNSCLTQRLQGRQGEACSLLEIRYEGPCFTRWEKDFDG
jgi:hypothetical protein